MTRTTTFSIVAVLVLGLAAWYFFGGDTPELPLTASAPALPAEQQFIDLAGRLGAISFDTSIFDDPRFMLLTSIATPIVPVSQGREDPFAPFGV